MNTDPISNIVEQVDKLVAEVLILQREVVRLGGDIASPITQDELELIPLRDSVDAMFA